MYDNVRFQILAYFSCFSLNQTKNVKYYRKSKDLTMEKSMQDSYTYNNTI